MNLVDPGTLKKFLGRHGIRAEKGLGQHFLCSEKAVSSIVNALDGLEGLVEIGPGPGVLTSPLSEQTQRFIALELDAKMVRILAESAPKAEVRLADALQVDLAAVLQELPEPRGVVSNMPYYITAPLLTRIAEVRNHFSRAVLMMQREVATRIVAKPGKRERGSLSVYMQANFEIRMVANVPPSAFLPPPKVDSTVLCLTPKAEGMPADCERLVRLGFAQPRKTLINNLIAGLHQPRDPITDCVEAIGLDELTRPQELTFEQWIELNQKLSGTLPSA